MEESIVNRVAASGLISIDLEDYLPKEEIVLFDLKDYLFRGLILKEKEFREALKVTKWENYTNKFAAITCSADAIIPMWAYMLASSYLQPFAKDVYVGTEKEMSKHLLLKSLSSLDIEKYADQRVIIKGCGEQEIDNSAYAEITKRLRPVAKSIMYGEACSNVPIYKKR